MDTRPRCFQRHTRVKVEDSETSIDDVTHLMRVSDQTMLGSDYGGDLHAALSKTKLNLVQSGPAFKWKIQDVIRFVLT